MVNFLLDWNYRRAAIWFGVWIPRRLPRPCLWSTRRERKMLTCYSIVRWKCPFNPKTTIRARRTVVVLRIILLKSGTFFIFLTCTFNELKCRFAVPSGFAPKKITEPSLAEEDASSPSRPRKTISIACSPVHMRSPRRLLKSLSFSSTDSLDDGFSDLLELENQVNLIFNQLFLIIKFWFLNSKTKMRPSYWAVSWRDNYWQLTKTSKKKPHKLQNVFHYEGHFL